MTECEKRFMRYRRRLDRSPEKDFESLPESDKALLCTLREALESCKSKVIGLRSELSAKDETLENKCDISKKKVPDLKHCLLDLYQDSDVNAELKHRLPLSRKNLCEDLCNEHSTGLGFGDGVYDSQAEAEQRCLSLVDGSSVLLKPGVHNLTGMSIGQSSYADYISHIEELTSFALKSTSDMPNDHPTSTHHGASARMPLVDFRLSCSGKPRLPVFCATPWGSLSSVNSLNPDFSPREGNASTQPTVLSPRADTVPVSSVCHCVPGCGVCTGDGSTRNTKADEVMMTGASSKHDVEARLHHLEEEREAMAELVRRLCVAVNLDEHDRLPRTRSLHYSGKKCSGVENAFDRADELEEEDGTSLSYCTPDGEQTSAGDCEAVLRHKVCSLSSFLRVLEMRQQRQHLIFQQEMKVVMDQRDSAMEQVQGVREMWRVRQTNLTTQRERMLTSEVHVLRTEKAKVEAEVERLMGDKLDNLHAIRLQEAEKAQVLLQDKCRELEASYVLEKLECNSVTLGFMYADDDVDSGTGCVV